MGNKTIKGKVSASFFNEKTLITIKVPWANSTLKLPEHETQEITFLKRPKMPIVNHSINKKSNF